MSAHTVDLPEVVAILGVKSSPNLVSVFGGLSYAGTQLGLNAYHRLVPYLAQLSHESLDFRYDREIWGPTAAQKRYEGREKLGNIYPGDGAKFSGHTAMQITGRYNTTEFMLWCRDKFGTSPDFVETPVLMNTDPWEGLGPLWYWDTRECNAMCDTGNFAAVTRVINGGYNGYDDRCARYTQIGLRVLGYSAGNIAGFQRDKRLTQDGVSGPNTRAAIHTALLAMPVFDFTQWGLIQEPPQAILPKATVGECFLVRWFRALFSKGTF